MSAGDGYFGFANSEMHNDLKTTSYCKDLDSHLIDNRGDSSETSKTWDNNFSERLANFMKNSKSLLENIDKKHNSVKFQHFEANSNDKTMSNIPESPTHTLVELEETLLQIDDSKSKHFQTNDNKRTSEPSSKAKISMDSNEKENVLEASTAVKKPFESQSQKYIVNKNYNFQEALRMDELENELHRLKSHTKDKDKKINILEPSSVSVPSTTGRVYKPNFKNIGTDVCTIYNDNPVSMENKTFSYHNNVGDHKPIDEFLINSSNKLSHNTENNESHKQYNGIHEYSSITDYNPNNSSALRNKIRDLESQIQDLQEANENAAQIMASLKPKNLIETSNNTHAMVSELIDKNKTLREEVDRLHQSIPALKGDSISSQFLRQELENLKEDLFTLKHQNSVIVMENIALKNQLKKKENTLSLPIKYDDRHPVLPTEPIKPNLSLCNDTYELNNHSKNLSDSDDSIYIPANSIVSNSQSKAMSMTNVSMNLKNMPKQPKKVCKMLPQSSRKKMSQLSDLYENAYTENDVSTNRQIGLNTGDNYFFEKQDMDLSHDSTDSILSDANKEMQEIIFQSEVENNIQTFSVKSKYDRISENGLEYDKSFAKSETKDLSAEPSSFNMNKFSTLGRTAYAPRASYDINIGDVVKFIRQGGRISRGLVHYVGPLPGRKDTYLGIELEVEDGKHDGIYDGKRYFQCIKNKGVFVAFNKIIMVYSKKI